MKFQAVVVALGLAGFALPGYAGRMSPLVDIGVGFGGDRLGTAQTSSNVEKVRAGQFLSFALGATFPIANDGDIEAQTSIGYFFDTVEANKGELSFIRYPIEAVVFKSITPKWRTGAGLTYHFNPRRNCTIPGCEVETVKFKNAFGAVLEVDYVLSDGGPASRSQSDDTMHINTIWLGLRYTRIEYQVSQAEAASTVGDTVSGNAFGVLLGVNF